ncbi:MAG: aldo/keto reductase [Flavisolibacter sp.]|nr:aldo/keto reductase [Flavisolibacter sp.]
MQYAQLGTSDLYVSRIGFGCMSLHDDKNISLIENAIEEGVNFFDTSDLYDKGLNESLVGKAIKNKREKIILSTKVGNIWRPDGSGWDWKPSKKYILKAVDESLSRLSTNFIDLYQLHGGTIEDPIDEIIEAFEKLKTSGKIRYYGLSSIRPNVVREYVKRSNITSLMTQYSFLDRRPEESIFPLVEANKIGVLARGSVAQGLLIDKPAKPYLDYSKHEVVKIQQKILSQNSDKTPIAKALNFVLQNTAVTSAVAGIRTKYQLKDLISIFNNPAFTVEDLQELTDIVPLNKYKEQR